MFYDDFCKTDIQKNIFKALLELSKKGRFIAIQELDYLGIPQTEIEQTLKYFEDNGLFDSVQHLQTEYPVLFSLKK